MKSCAPWTAMVIVFMEVSLTETFYFSGKDDEYISDESNHKFHDFCEKYVAVSEYLTFQMLYKLGSKYCSVSFYAKRNYHTLKVYFLAYSVNKECSGAINIFNSDFKPQLGIEGYCQLSKPNKYFDLGYNGTIVVYPGRSSVYAVLRIVEYTPKGEERCENDSIECEKDKICISEDLECDEFPDCPDKTDEVHQCAHLSIIHFIILAFTIVSTTGCCICWFVWCSSYCRSQSIFDFMSP